MKTFLYKTALPFLALALLCCFSGNLNLLNAQAGCPSISWSIIKLEPCRYRLFVNNMTPDCYNEATLLLESGYYTGFTANATDGWVVEQLSSTELLLTNANGLFPAGAMRTVDFDFFEPGGSGPILHVLYPNLCVMEGCFADFPLEGCEGGCVSGTVYRECDAAPYSNQQSIAGWTIDLLDAMGTVVSSTETDVAGYYSVCDLPPGQYIVRGWDANGHWTPSVPASGQYAMSVSAGGNQTRDFGLCPVCSCDSLDIIISQQAGNGDTSIYSLTGYNTGAYCFQQFTISVDTGQLIDWAAMPGWVVERIGNTLLVTPEQGGYLAAESFDPCYFRIAGIGNHVITVSITYDGVMAPVECKRLFSIPSPPGIIALNCCPAGTTQGPELVVNGDFNVTQAPPAPGSGYTTDYTWNSTGAGDGNFSVLNSVQTTLALGSYWACIGKTGDMNTDYFMVVNGHPDPNRVVWRASVTVAPATQYSFSVWVNNLIRPIYSFYTDPVVQIKIIDPATGTVVAMSPPLTLPESPDRWENICLKWTAPTNVSNPYQLEVRAPSTFSVNDFALDCISFRACEPTPCQADFSVNFVDNCGHVQLVNTSAGVPPFSTLWNDSSSGNTLNLNLPCGSYTYCMTVTDAENCTSSVCKTFTVSDNIPPVAVCVPGFGVELDASCQFILSAGMIDGGSTDNCQVQSLNLSQNLISGCGDFQVTLTVTDWCGNTSTCTTGIQSIEAEPPVIKCPADITAQGNPALGGIQIQLPPPDVLTDNCAVAGYITDPANGLFPCGAATLVLYTATDACGNTATCEMSVIVEDCAPISVDTCCAFALQLVNKYTDGRVKYVRVTGLCDTKICCTDPDEWVEVTNYPYHVSWYPPLGAPVPFGTAIDNDFILYLSEAGLNSFQVEWIDQNEIVICRHVIDIACNGMFDEEEEDWTKYTSTTGLDDPNLFVFAVREDSEDGESDCEPEEKTANVCPFTSTITCSTLPNYMVTLHAPSGYTQFTWSVVQGPSYPSISSVQNPVFFGSPGSYVITLLADDGNGNACTGEEEIIIPNINPDFTWSFEDCPNNMAAKFTASGLDDISSFSWSSTSGTVSPCCTNPVTINFPAQTTYTVTLSATDIYGCTHTVSHPVTVDLNCKAGLEVEKFVFCPTDCAGVTTKPVTVTFGNLSTGGKCPVSYKWDFGNGNMNTVTNKNDVPHTYTVPCPGGRQYSVTLTMTDADNKTCTETIIADITPCEVDFTYIICPDGKVIFEGSHKGEWSFPGSHSTAPWPYSDLKDKKGYRKKVVVRYDQSGVYTVTFKGVCDNGGECTIVKEFFIMLECCAKNDRMKKNSYFSGGSGGQFKMKYKFAQNQLPFFHHIKAKTQLKKKKTKLGITFWKNTKADEMETSFLGLVYKRDADKCNCKVPFTVPNTSSGLISAKKAKAKYSFYLTRFRSRQNSLTSTHYTKKEGTPETKQLQLGKDCDKFRWWLDWF